MTFAYVLIVCLIILVCALIHDNITTRERLADLEEEVADAKLEYRGLIKRLASEYNLDDVVALIDANIEKWDELIDSLRLYIES